MWLSRSMLGMDKGASGGAGRLAYAPAALDARRGVRHFASEFAFPWLSGRARPDRWTYRRLA